MTLEDYTNKLNEAGQTPDRALTIYTEVLDNLKGDLTTLESLKVQAGKDAETIAELRDTNIKLFLSQTGGKAENVKEEPQKTRQDYVNEFLSKFNNEGGK